MAACTNQAKKVYEESTYGPPLEVPPDLTAPPVDKRLSIPAINASQAEVKAGLQTPATLPKVTLDTAGVEVQRDGAQRWLVIKGEPNQLWPWARDFFLDSGFFLDHEDAQLGVVETDWKQQRVEMPKDYTEVMLDEELLKVFAVPLREKYRIRLEAGVAAGSTEIYLTHRSAELLMDDDDIVWHLRGSDPEMEADMLKRLMIYLGVAQEKAGGLLAKATRRSGATIKEDEGGKLLLRVDQSFLRAWRRIGLALERLSYVIEDRDRGNGIYYVRRTNPLAGQQEEPGWFASLFSSEPELKAYEIVLKDEGESVDVLVRDEKKEPIVGQEARDLLEQLSQHLE